MADKTSETASPFGNKPLLLGFGEAAQAFVSGWSGSGITGFAAYDVKTAASPAERDGKLADYQRHGVVGYGRLDEAVRGAQVVFSLVTADRALEAAASVSEHIGSSVLYLDCNSCAPRTKQKAAEIIERQDAVYVDVAVMAPVHPQLHRTPLIVSGADAEAAAGTLQQAGMNTTIAGLSVGQASAIKLCRSIMVKGMEALMAECLLSARSLGVEEAVLSSLEASDPGCAWRSRAEYAFSRMAVHGERRAAEMFEAASMVADLSIAPRMSEATAQWQRQIGGLRSNEAETDFPDHLDELIKLISK